jgi:hypothetical protein
MLLKLRYPNTDTTPKQNEKAPQTSTSLWKPVSSKSVEERDVFRKALTKARAAGSENPAKMHATS